MRPVRLTLCHWWIFTKVIGVLATGEDITLVFSAPGGSTLVANDVITLDLPECFSHFRDTIHLPTSQPGYCDLCCCIMDASRMRMTCHDVSERDQQMGQNQFVTSHGSHVTLEWKRPEAKDIDANAQTALFLCGFTSWNVTSQTLKRT